MSHPFIVLEGLSACGKTTIGAILAKQLAGVLYKTPPEPFAGMRIMVDKKADPVARFLFYLASVVQSSTEICRICKDQPVICDRYIDTTVCYHQVIGVPARQFADVIKMHIRIPDYVFLITCRQEVRVNRLFRRGLSYNDLVERRGGLETEFLAEYKKREMIEIDNTCGDPQVAANSIVNHLSRAK